MTIKCAGAGRSGPKSHLSARDEGWQASQGAGILSSSDWIRPGSAEMGNVGWNHGVFEQER